MNCGEMTKRTLIVSWFRCVFCNCLSRDSKDTLVAFIGDTWLHDTHYIAIRTVDSILLSYFITVFALHFSVIKQSLFLSYSSRRSSRQQTAKSSFFTLIFEEANSVINCNEQHNSLLEEEAQIRVVFNYLRIVERVIALSILVGNVTTWNPDYSFLNCRMLHEHMMQSYSSLGLSVISFS